MTTFKMNDAVVAKFHDRSDDEFELTEMAGPNLVALYNKYSGKEAIKKFSDKETAVKRVAQVLAEAKPAKEPGTRGRNPKTAGDAKLYRIVKENPRREGTWGYKSWELIKDGMTVDEYLKAGGRRNDLAWDVARNRIEIRT